MRTASGTGKRPAALPTPVSALQDSPTSTLTGHTGSVTAAPHEPEPEPQETRPSGPSLHCSGPPFPSSFSLAPAPGPLPHPPAACLPFSLARLHWAWRLPGPGKDALLVTLPLPAPCRGSPSPPHGAHLTRGFCVALAFSVCSLARAEALGPRRPIHRGPLERRWHGQHTNTARNKGAFVPGPCRQVPGQHH